jgi:hypothetical protein
MKKIGSTMILLLLFLLPNATDASYLILLKNGGKVATPFYWYEGRFIFFRYAGGTAGVERREIDRVQSIDDSEKQGDGNSIIWNPGIKEPPPALPLLKKAPDTEKPKEVKEEKVDTEAYKKKKDQMNSELDRLLEQQRQAYGIADEDARRKLIAEMDKEIIKVSKDIYKLTDEVTEKNKGKLPDGWWGNQ